MRNASLGPYVQADFSPPEYIVVVNALFYASLGIMLLAAFIAMLIKSWVREFDRGLQAITIPEQRAKTREFRYLGMEHWKLQEMVAILPMLIQMSLLLFAIGLILFLFNISKPSFGITTAIFGIGVIYYAITTTISVFVTSSPFHSPLSRIFGSLYRLVHAFICPGRDHFLSPNMDTSPATRLGRFGRRIQISLQKFRPYSEKEFENPITAATVDEFQVSTAASVLQRIHDSVPNSQHSQLIHQSVWQVAGSPALRIDPSFKLPSCALDRGNDNKYFSRLSSAGVVGLKSVFVRMRDARYKERIAAVRHIDRSPSHSHEPMAQLVHAIFDLLPNDFFPDERHALLHPASVSNALHRDALLRHALPDLPLLRTLRNTLLRNSLRNAPLRDNALHNALIPDGTFRNSFRRVKVFFTTLTRSMSDINRVLWLLFLGVLNVLRRARINKPFSEFTIPLIITYIITFGVPLGLSLGLPLTIVVTVVTTAFRGPFAVLHGILFCDDVSQDRYDCFRGDLPYGFRDGLCYHCHDGLDDAYDDARSYAPFFNISTPLFEALVLVYGLFRNAVEDPSLHKTLREALFCEAPFRSSLRLLFRSNTRFDDMTTQGRISRAHLEPEEPKDLVNILQRNQPQDEEAIWLLNTLSVLHCDGLVLLHVSRMCLTILLHRAPKWTQKTSPNIMLIEAVVTLVAISCSSNEAYQRKTLTSSHQHPWLLVNLRNPELISRMIENINDNSRKELISLLFLVLYGLFLRGSKALAVQYLAIITAKCDFWLCASALAVIAPALGDDIFFAIGGSLLAPQTQDLFNDYDLQLGASQPPDREPLAILVLLSKNLGPRVEKQLRYTNLELRNPWLRLVANVIARRGIPDESGMDFEPFHDHRVQNMIAALSLLRCSAGNVHHHQARESTLLALFLPSTELVISSLALHCYIVTVISHDNPPPPSHYLTGAVHALFSPIIPDDYLPKGWEILHMFMDGFEELSIEWRRTFAEAFFTMSHRPLLGQNGQNGTPVTELSGILTWEYFCNARQQPEFTDRVFSGLDWMAMAWSLRLAQQSSTTTTVLAQRAAQPPDLRESPVNEEFVLKVLCRLLGAAPYYSILPIIPKLREFVEWFDDPKLIDYQSMVSARIEGAEKEYERPCKFQKVNCMWYL